MKNFIQDLERNRMNELAKEHSTEQLFKMSLTVPQDQVDLIDSMAEFYMTNRVDVMREQIKYAIQSLFIAAKKEDLIEILTIASKKSSQWDATLEEVKHRPEGQE
jgi:hypothetical protein